MKLKDKVAIVTGGARGIGEAIARAYAAEGAHVVIADIEIAKAQELASELGAKGLAVQLDVRDSKSISALIATTVSRFGGVDILVNNAAIFDMAPILEVSEASFDNQFAINVKGLFFMLQAVASQMTAQGRGGKIINMASQAGRRGEALVAVYCATKAAVISLTQSAGLGLIKNGINVNGIAPGVVDTPMWDQVDSLFAKYENLPLGEKKRQVGAAVPAGRMGTPDDYRGVAIFLASHDFRLHRCADFQRRWRKLDELMTGVLVTGSEIVGEIMPTAKSGRGLRRARRPRLSRRSLATD